MKRVEIFGTEGIGKTTLFNEVVRQRKKNDKWMTFDEARVKIAYEYCVKHSKESFQYILMAILLKACIHKIIGSSLLQSYLCDAALGASKQTTFLRQDNGNTNFCNLILDFCDIEEYTPQLRLARISKLYRIVSDTIFLEKHDGSNIVIADSDIISMYGLLLPQLQSELSDNMVEKFFQIMPPPAGLIYCKLDTEETVKRILERQKNQIIVLTHLDPQSCDSLIDINTLRILINRQSYMAAKGLNILKERGVKVLELDMSDTQEINVEKVLKFLDELHH